MSYRTKLHLINLVSWIVFFILYTVLFFIQTDASLDTTVNYRGNLSLIFIVPVIGALNLLFLMHKKEKYDDCCIYITHSITCELFRFRSGSNIVVMVLSI